MHMFFFQRKKKSKRQITFRSIDTLFFAISVSSFHSPCMHICVALFDVHKDAHIFLHGKQKSKRRVLFFRCFCLFFSVPKYAHVYCRGKRRTKGKWRWKSAVICLFPALSPLFQSLYMHRFRLRRCAERVEVFFFSGKKEKPKDDAIGGVYASALSPLFHLIFSFLPLYLHRGLRPRLVCGKGEGILFSEKKEEQKTDNVRGNRHLLFRHFCLFFSPSIHFGCRLFFCVSSSPAGVQTSPGEGGGFTPPLESVRKRVFDPLHFFRGRVEPKDR